MIIVSPNRTFKSTTEPGYFATGLVGTIGVTIYDDSGTIIVARATTGIIELVAGTGIYSATSLEAPSGSGQYTIYWDDGSGGIYIDDLLVVGDAAVPPIVGGAVATSTLSDRIRRAVRDYPARDTVAAAMDTPDTAINVTNDTAGYAKGSVIVVDEEAMLVTTSPQGSGSYAVTRGWLGTDVAQHTAGAAVLISPRFSPSDVLDAINEGVRNLWPYFFKRVVDTTITTTSDLQADYALPTAFGTQGIVTHMEVLYPGLTNDGWRGYRWFHHMEGSGTRTLSFVKTPPVGTALRLIGYGPFAGEVAYGGTTDVEMLPDAVTAISLYARYYLKLQDEAQRTLVAGAQNIGPSAVAAGGNLNLAEAYYKQWQSFCMQHQQRYPKWRTRRAV